MQPELSHEQRRIIADCAARNEAEARWNARLRAARQGPSWMWVPFAVLIWGFVTTAATLDLSTASGRAILFSFPVTLALMGGLMHLAMRRSREALLLALLKEEAPESYRRLLKERIISDRSV